MEHDPDLYKQVYLNFLIQKYSNFLQNANYYFLRLNLVIISVKSVLHIQQSLLFLIATNVKEKRKTYQLVFFYLNQVIQVLTHQTSCCVSYLFVLFLCILNT